MANILEEIVAHTRHSVAQRKQHIPGSSLESYEAFHRPTLNLARVLDQKGLQIIAELKKASPSKGVIRSDFDIPELARSYAQNGAAAISVLTEPDYFQGSLQNLARARQAVQTPLLRKDFIVDPYQLLEARAYGADAVLLIATVLDGPQLFDLHQTAEALGLSCLVEVYAIDELDHIDFDQVRILGVNNRDLKTFSVDLDNSLRVFEQIPDTVIRVAESGLKQPRDLAYLCQHGIHAFLIGETFMRASNPGQMLQNLRTETEILIQGNVQTP